MTTSKQTDLQQRIRQKQTEDQKQTEQLLKQQQQATQKLVKAGLASIRTDLRSQLIQQLTILTIGIIAGAAITSLIWLAILKLLQS